MRQSITISQPITSVSQSITSVSQSITSAFEEGLLVTGEGVVGSAARDGVQQLVLWVGLSRQGVHDLDVLPATHNHIPHLFFNTSFIRCRKCGSPYLGKATAVARALTILTNVCSIFASPNSCMVASALGF